MGVQSAVEAAPFPAKIELQIVPDGGRKDTDSKWSLSIDVTDCLNSEGVPLLENLTSVVTDQLCNLGSSIYGNASEKQVTLTRNPPYFQYIDREGDDILIPAGDEDSFLDALGEFAGLATLKMSVEASFPPLQEQQQVVTKIKLCLVGADKRCRQCSFDEISDSHGKPSLAKLVPLASELSGSDHGPVALVYNGDEGRSYLLESDDELARHADRCAAQQKPTFKIMVQAAQSKSIRVVFGGPPFGSRSISVPADLLVDSDTGRLSYSKLDSLTRLDLVAFPEKILFSFSSRNKKMLRLVRNDRDLESAINGLSRNEELRVFCQKHQSVWNFLAVLVAMLGIVLAILSPDFGSWTRSLVTVFQPWVNLDDKAQLKLKVIKAIETKDSREEVRRQVVLSPLTANVRGRHCQVRKLPQPYVLFFHKSNLAQWAIPSDTAPGHYAAWTQVSRRGPGWTKLHAGVLVNEDVEELNAFHYRQKLKEIGVQPTGDWNRFRHEYLGEFQVTGNPGELFLVVATQDKPNVDFQAIVLTWTRALN